MLRSAFEIDAEEPSLVEQIVPNQRYAVLTVERVVPAAPPPLAQIQTRSARRWSWSARSRGPAPSPTRSSRGSTAAPRRRRRSRRRRCGCRRRIGRPPAARAQRPERGAALADPVRAAAGPRRVIAAPSNAGWFVVHHQQRTPGNASTNPLAIRAMGQGLTESAAEEMAQQFARAIQQATGAERNEDAIRAARERLLGATIQ